MNEVDRISHELKRGIDARPSKVLFGSGAGDVHKPAEEYRVKEGFNKPNAKIIEAAIVMNAAGQQNMLWAASGIAAGLPVAVHHPRTFGIFENGTFTVTSGSVVGLKNNMDRGFVAYTHGDVVGVNGPQAYSIASTETVFKALTPLLGPNLIMIFCDTAVFDKNPRVYPDDAKQYHLIDPRNIEEVLLKLSDTGDKVRVTGAMRDKVIKLWDMIKDTDRRGFVADGTKPGVMEKLLRGDESESPYTTKVIGK